jgi:hypothetical protein
MTLNSSGELDALQATVRERFQAEKRVLSFEEYLDEFCAHPARHTRDAARYVRDCFDFYASYELPSPLGKRRRFRLFDQEFLDGTRDGEGRYRLLGHEHVQEFFYRTLLNYVREGRTNRLVLLHGPNGSAKSTFAACVLRALEIC